MRGSVSDPIDSGPFRRWAESWIDSYRDGEDGATEILEGGGTTALALGLFPGDTEETAARKLWRWRFENRRLGQGELEAALDNFDVFLWEIYEEEGFCTNCDQRVNVQSGGRCLVCGGPTGRAMSKRERLVRRGRECPRCGGRKSRDALRCVDCRRRAAADALRGNDGRIAATRFAPEDYRCGCGNRKQPASRTCWDCYVAGGSHTGRRNRKGDDTLRKITEEVLADAYALYEEGLSLRRTAAAIFARTQYANERSCANALKDAFDARGWPLRDRVAAITAHNKKRHADLPFCGYEKADGTTCIRRTSKGRCWHHREENMKPRLEMLRAGRPKAFVAAPVDQEEPARAA